MRLFISEAAQHQLERFPVLLHTRVIKKLRFFIQQSDPMKYAVPISGTPYHRFRVGDHRIIFESKNNEIKIVSIERRDKAYQ